MNIKLVPVTFEEKDSFVYDFSLYTDHEVNKEGSSEENIEYFWGGNKRESLFHRVGLEPLFAFRSFCLRISIPIRIRHMSYMILQKYRRNGIDQCAAKKKRQTIRQGKHT